METLRSNLGWGLRQGVSLIEVVAVFGITGTFGGLIVGSLRAAGRNLIGAMLLGYVVAALLFLSYGIVDTPLIKWQRKDLIDVLILAAILGPAGGAIAWRQSRGN